MYQLSQKPLVLKGFIIFEQNDFLELCDVLWEDWRLPRNGSSDIRQRKHGIESSLMGTFAAIRGGLTLYQIEGLLGIDHSLIYLDLFRNVKLLLKHLDHEMSWPSHEEQLILVGFNDTFSRFE